MYVIHLHIQLYDFELPLFSSAKGSALCYLLFLLLLTDPVVQELTGRAIAQRGMLSLPVVKHLDVFKAGGLHFCVGRKVMPCTRSFLKLLNQLSVGALSQQLPLRLMEQRMPYS